LIFSSGERALFAERRAEALDGLLHTLPSRLANPDAAERIVSWLSEALDADVLAYSADRGVFASSPDSSTNLARAVISASPYTDRVEHSRRVQIYGTGDEAVLAFGSHRTFDETAGRLIRHAAKVLGLIEQARLDHHAAVLAPRSVSQAATQLLLAGQVVPGQAMADTIHPELMRTEEVVVRIIDTGAQEREPTLQWCERTLHDRALVAPCPGKDRQIIVITPNRLDDSVEADLRAQAVQIGLDAGDGSLAGQSLVLLARCAERGGDLQQAGEHLARALDIGTRDHHQKVIRKAKEGLARIGL
jgi:hypothetical protein